MRCIRIGTRGSMLAMAQARIVSQALHLALRDIETQLVPIVTSGDRSDGPLALVGGKGLFTAEIQQALRDGSIDLAVHSAKDLPAGLDGEFVIAAVPPREDPRDAIVSRRDSLADLPPGAKVGTSSLRRRAQLLAIRSDLEIQPVRGNLETRIGKVFSDDGARGQQSLEAIVVAMAGLKRSGLIEAHAGYVEALDAEPFIPAAGQGALAVQTCADNTEAAELVLVLNDPPSHQAIEAERAVVRALGASCRSCLAVHVQPACGSWLARAMVARSDGSGMILASAEGQSADLAGIAILDLLERQGAKGLLSD